MSHRRQYDVIVSSCDCIDGSMASLQSYMSAGYFRGQHSYIIILNIHRQKSDKAQDNEGVNGDATSLVA